jgi:hypothetical protein
MAIQPPNNGLVTETAQQYYQGAQGTLQVNLLLQVLIQIFI